MFPRNLQFSWRDLWSFPIFSLFLCIVHLRSSCHSLLFSGTLHSLQYIFNCCFSSFLRYLLSLLRQPLCLLPFLFLCDSFGKLPPVQCYEPSSIVLQAPSTRSNPWIYSSPLLYNHKGVDPGKNSRVGCHFLLQRSSQGSNLCLLCLLHWQVGSLPLVLLGNSQNLNGLVIFPTFFNLSLNFAIRSSWPKSQSAPSLVFADCIQLLYLWLQRT